MSCDVRTPRQVLVWVATWVCETYEAWLGHGRFRHLICCLRRQLGKLEGSSSWGSNRTGGERTRDVYLTRVWHPYLGSLGLFVIRLAWSDQTDGWQLKRWSVRDPGFPSRRRLKVGCGVWGWAAGLLQGAFIATVFSPMDFESELLTVLSLDEKDKYITFTRFFCGVVMNSISGFLPIRTVPVLGLVLHVVLGLELRPVAWRMKGEIIR